MPETPPMVPGFATVLAESIQGWGFQGKAILGTWHATRSVQWFGEDDRYAIATSRCGVVAERFEECDFAAEVWSECCSACRHLIHLELGDVWLAAQVRDRMLGGKD